MIPMLIVERERLNQLPLNASQELELLAVLPRNMNAVTLYEPRKQGDSNLFQRSTFSKVSSRSNQFTKSSVNNSTSKHDNAEEVLYLEKERKHEIKRKMNLLLGELLKSITNFAFYRFTCQLQRDRTQIGYVYDFLKIKERKRLTNFEAVKLSLEHIVSQFVDVLDVQLKVADKLDNESYNDVQTQFETELKMTIANSSSGEKADDLVSFRVQKQTSLNDNSAINSNTNIRDAFAVKSNFLQESFEVSEINESMISQIKQIQQIDVKNTNRYLEPDIPPNSSSRMIEGDIFSRQELLSPRQDVASPRAEFPATDQQQDEPKDTETQRAKQRNSAPKKSTKSLVDPKSNSSQRVNVDKKENIVHIELQSVSSSKNGMKNEQVKVMQFLLSTKKSKILQRVWMMLLSAVVVLSLTQIVTYFVVLNTYNNLNDLFNTFDK